MVQPSAAADQRTFSPRRRLRHRVLIFSGVSGLVTALAGLIAFGIADLYLPLGRLADANAQTLQRLRCDTQTCDMSEINADWEFETPDYILDKTNYFFLSTTTSDLPGFPLRYADAEFVLGFVTPNSFLAPDGEQWRLHSVAKSIGGTRVAVMVGYAEKASWKMDLPTNVTALDAALRQQLERIAGALLNENDKVAFREPARRRIAADGYVVLDTRTNAILFGGYSLPLHFPRSQPLPNPGTTFYRQGRQLYVVRSDSNDRLLVVNTERVGDLLSLLTVLVLSTATGFTIAFRSGMTFLRKFFVLTSRSAHNYDDALRLGEGLTVEFKRSISFDVQSSVDRILETIAAFANTADGTIS